MKILFVALMPPYPLTHGQRMRHWALLRALAAQGHRTTLAAFDAPDSAEGLARVKEVCERVEYVPLPETARQGRNAWARLRTVAGRVPHGAWKYRSAPMAKLLASLLRGGEFDAVICNEIYAYINLPQPCPAPLVLDKSDVTSLILRRYVDCERNPALRMYGRLEYRKLRAWERGACGAATHVVACSEVDARQLRELCPGAAVSVVPNVIDMEAYLPGGREEENTLLYCGSMDWYPNKDAVRYFLSEIMPALRQAVPGVRLTVTGTRPSAEFVRRFDPEGRVEFTGRVPDVRPIIARCAVSIVPLRIGSGTRLKILEAAAMGRAVVSTRLGAEGLDLVDGAEIKLADTPEEFARAVADLLADPGRRAAMGMAARRRVAAQYSQQSLEAALEPVLHALWEPARRA